MNVSLHPSHWFHHTDAGKGQLRHWLHSENFKMTMIILGIILAFAVIGYLMVNTPPTTTPTTSPTWHMPGYGY